MRAQNVSVAATVLALSSFAFGQTYTDCNPLTNTSKCDSWPLPSLYWLLHSLSEWSSSWENCHHRLYRRREFLLHRWWWDDNHLRHRWRWVHNRIGWPGQDYRQQWLHILRESLGCIESGQWNWCCEQFRYGVRRSWWDWLGKKIHTCTGIRLCLIFIGMVGRQFYYRRNELLRQRQHHHLR